MNEIVTLLAIVVLLSACSPSTPMNPSPTIKPTEQPSATLFPTDTVTSNLAPTNTEEPTITPTKENTPNIEPTSAATPTTPNQSLGLGMTRVDAARMYKFLEFNFNLETNEQGQEVYVGTISDELATVTLIGPVDNISSISVVLKVPKPPTENQSSRTMVYLATLLTVAADDWAEGTDWLNESLNKMGESRTTFDNRDVVLIITPEDNKTTVEFTISAK